MGELRSIYKACYGGVTYEGRCVVVKYDASDHTHPRCIVAGIPRDDAVLYKHTLLKK